MPIKAKYDDSVKAGNCCATCLYNIPQGTLVLLLPGICLLIMGAIMFALEDDEESWREGIVSSGLVMLVLGVGLTLVGSTMCIWTIVCTSRKNKAHRRPEVTEYNRNITTISGTDLYGMERGERQPPPPSNGASRTTSQVGEIPAGTELAGVYRINNEMQPPYQNGR